GATRTWDGGGDNKNWTTAANWVGDLAPAAGDDLVFAGSVRTTSNNDFAAGTAYSSITFSNGAFTLKGNAVTLTGTGASRGITNTAGSDLIEFGVTAATNPLTISAAAGTLTLSGPMANGGMLLTVAGNGNTVIGGVISGAGGLTKQGAGQLTLSV